jgi:hypothetical protein
MQFAQMAIKFNVHNMNSSITNKYFAARRQRYGVRNCWCAFRHDVVLEVTARHPITTPWYNKYA